MKTKVCIISGFLGAGKTTLIRQMLKNELANRKVAVIENDFGEINIDAEALSTDGIQVISIESGCICCSLSGNFATALRSLCEKYQPDVILIEPSGVGKLSEIQFVCREAEKENGLSSPLSVTVVDVSRFEMYFENFGDFFLDQIHHADRIYLTRVSDFTDVSHSITERIKQINPEAVLLSDKGGDLPNFLDTEVCTDHDHTCTDHDHACADHDHAESRAEDIFDHMTIRADGLTDSTRISRVFEYLEKETAGQVIRAKGYLATKEGLVSVQYTPGDLQIANALSGEPGLVMIGVNLRVESTSDICSRILRGEM